MTTIVILAYVIVTIIIGIALDFEMGNTVSDEDRPFIYFISLAWLPVVIIFVLFSLISIIARAVTFPFRYVVNKLWEHS